MEVEISHKPLIPLYTKPLCDLSIKSTMHAYQSTTLWLEGVLSSCKLLKHFQGLYILV